ncbi:MAG: hypothetical protein LBT57_01745 [Puniceicoccales bacterium]|jgi:hypothetical protein|nr:hypothetical protein [Puniceicoccales bacterium]
MPDLEPNHDRPVLPDGDSPKHFNLYGERLDAGPMENWEQTLDGRSAEQLAKLGKILAKTVLEDEADSVFLKKVGFPRNGKMWRSEQDERIIAAT